MKREDNINISVDPLEVAGRVIRLEAAAVQNLANVLDESFVQAVELILSCKGRVVVTGLGKSGAIGRKISATLASTGTVSYFLHAGDGLHGDFGVFHKDDVAICVSKSGNSEELFQLMAALKKIGVPTISMVANRESPLARHSDIVLFIGEIEEACPHDLAPTTSTTATLVLGDALAIALLEKRHFSKEDFAFLHPGGTLGKRLLLKVEDLMEQGPLLPLVPLEAKMKLAVMKIAAHRGICIVEDEQHKVAGVITNGDLVRLLERTEHFIDIPVKEIMNADPKIISPATLAYTAYKKMEKFSIIALPVVNSDGAAIGVIHLHDIMRAGIV